MESPESEIHQSSDNIKKKKTDLSEDIAIHIWGWLYGVKTQIGKYIKGKLSQDDLASRTRHFLKRFYHLRQNYEVLKQNLETLEFTQARKRLYIRGSVSSMISLLNAPPKEESKILNNLMYALLLDDYLVFYVPSKGQKRIQRLGGKEETFSTNTTSQNQLHLSIHLLRNAEESVKIAVSPSITLDKILRHLANKPYWESEDIRKSNPFIKSFSKTTQSILKHKPKFIERSKNFHNELTGLLSLLDYGTHKAPLSRKGMTSVQLSQIGFAKKTINIYDSSPTFVRLNLPTQTAISQCFTQQELSNSSEKNPLALFLFLSTSNIQDMSASNNLPAGANRTVFVTEDMLNYLASLISKEPTEEVEIKDTKKVITEMTESLFAMLEDIMPNLSQPINSPTKPLVSKIIVLILFTYFLVFDCL